MDSGFGRSIDRLSNLPESILVHILSFLPTKYAVGTSVLSKRWEYLWASVPNLDFDDSLLFTKWCSLSKERKAEVELSFMNFADRVMLLSDVSSLQKFHIIYSSDDNYDHVNTWVCAAVKRKVKEMRLEYLPDCFHVSLPHMLFTSQTLVALILSQGIFLEIPAAVWLPNLKILHLDSIKHENGESAQKLFSGCPVLEELFLGRWTVETIKVLEVSVPTLKHLTVQCFADDFSDDEDESGDPGKLAINGPSLEHLYLQDFVSEDFLVENLSSLLNASVDIGCACSEESTRLNSYVGCVYKLLGGIANVKSLSLSESTLSYLTESDDYVLPKFDHVTCLKLGINGDSQWNLLADFLECSPNVEIIILEKGFKLLTSFKFEIPIVPKARRLINTAKSWCPPRRVPNCLLYHLKEIRIENFNGARYEHEAVEYLLKNALVLKEMRIDCRYATTKEDFRLCRKLTRFPRVSKTSRLNLRF